MEVQSLDALLAEGKVIRIDRKYFANDPTKLRARTGKSIGHGTQVGVKASRFCVDQLELGRQAILPLRVFHFLYL
jgi:hypothetical protein